MKDQGFTYQPVPYAAVGPAQVGDGVPAWGTVDFAQEYGYGVTTASELGALLVPAQLPEDPNQDYVGAMSESERQAYWAALYGDLATDLTGLTADEVEWDWTKAGCSGLAQHEVDQGGTDTSALLAALSSLYEEAATDPRYQAARQVWAGCMADAGYTYTAPDDPQRAINDEFALALDPTTGAADPAAMADLRRRELATAVDDAECRDSSELDETLARVTVELEEAFYALHRDEVDAWFAEQASGEG